jgi:hypothetical protein
MKKPAYLKTARTPTLATSPAISQMFFPRGLFWSLRAMIKFARESDIRTSRKRQSYQP